MVSSHSLGKIASKFHAMKTRVDNIKEKAEETMGQVLQTAEIGAAAGGFAYANGRMGNIVKGHATPEITIPGLGLPADLGAAVALHGLAFAGAAGKHKEHAHNLGDGALASFLVRMGLTMGAAKRSAPVKAVAGAFPQGNTNPWANYGYHPGVQAQAVGSPWAPVG